jgi:predicted RNA-binding protein YlqC (UPF0109 family)
MAEKSAAAELVEYVAKAIVSDGAAVNVREPEPGLLELETAPDDRGRVIGRQGRVAKAMRVVLGASRAGADHRLEIVD